MDVNLYMDVWINDHHAHTIQSNQEIDQYYKLAFEYNARPIYLVTVTRNYV